MIGKKLLGTKPVCLADVKEMLKERSQDGELTYEQTLTNDYSKKFAKLPKTKAQKLLASLGEMDSMTDELAVKIVDICPQSIDILRLLVPKNAKFSDETIEKIIGLVKENQ